MDGEFTLRGHIPSSPHATKTTVRPFLRILQMSTCDTKQTQIRWFRGEKSASGTQLSPADITKGVFHIFLVKALILNTNH